jgi:hypothetical protein
VLESADESLYPPAPISVLAISRGTAPPSALWDEESHFSAPSTSPSKSAIALPKTLEARRSLSDSSGCRQPSFFLRQNSRLGDKRPLDALRDREIEAVERAARAYGEHGAE